MRNLLATAAWLIPMATVCQLACALNRFASLHGKD